VETIGKVLLGIGLALVVGGVAFLLLARLGVRRLPGDIVVRRGNFTFYAPLGLMIVLSLLLTLVLNLFSRR
jgi:multisubunit Na+/H+ antiporter MnhG subunit